MAKGKTSSKSDQNYWSRYKSNKVWETNRKRKLAKHLKKHPKDSVAEKAVNNIKYRRQTPKAPFWTPGMIHVAGLFKQYAGYVNKEIFNPNHKIRDDALAGYNRRGGHTNSTSRVDYSIGARAHNKYGALAWNG